MPTIPTSPLSLKVLHPCTRTWDSLDGDTHRRYCDDCNLHVHNVSELTDHQARKLLASPGRICISGLAKSDGLLLTKDRLRDEAKHHLRRRPLLRIAAALGLISIPTALAACAQQRLQGDCNAALSDSKQTTEPEYHRLGGALPAIQHPTPPSSHPDIPAPIYPGMMQRPTLAPHRSINLPPTPAPLDPHDP